MWTWSKISIWAGVAVLAVSIWLFGQSLSLTANALGAEGRVVRVAQEYISRAKGDKYSGGIAYYAVIRFRAESGEEIEFRTRGNNTPPYRLGSELPVIYHADNPSRARVYGFGPIWASPVFTALLGILLIGFGMGLSKRRRQSQPIA